MSNVRPCRVNYRNSGVIINSTAGRASGEDTWQTEIITATRTPSRVITEDAETRISGSYLMIYLLYQMSCYFGDLARNDSGIFQSSDLCNAISSQPLIARPGPSLPSSWTFSSRVLLSKYAALSVLRCLTWSRLVQTSVDLSISQCSAARRTFHLHLPPPRIQSRYIF